MGTLTTLRGVVAQVLTDAGIPSYDHLPARLAPPCALVAASSPYLTTEDAPHGSTRMRLEIRLVVRPGDNAQITNDLDDLVETALTALTPTTWAVEEVSQPYNLVIGTTSYLATSLVINDDITL